MKAPPIAIFLLAAGAFLAGCARTSAGAGAAGRARFHQNVPPHGGTAVALGDDYSLELVRDGASGTLSAYILDDEMEEFIRSPMPAITIAARIGGQEQALVLAAVASAATGETVGDTALFQARADWLERTPKFSGTLRRITVRGTAFTDVPFDFPGGSARE